MKQTKKILAIILALSLVFSLGIIGMSATAADEVETLDIFSFNDFHGAVDKSASSSNPGADRFTAIVQELMSENPNSVLLAAGDLYQGSPLSNIFLGEPVSEMIRYLGVEYSAIGNHEFDWGQDKISKFAEDGDLTFLAANIIDTATGENPDYCQPYAIIELGTKTIGLIGLTTTVTPSIVKGEYVEGLEFLEPGDWLNDLIAELREDGCDLVIALTHMGGDQIDDVITGEIADLAETCPDFDAIIGGHHHTLVAGTVNDVAIVIGNYNGRGLGRLTFEFDGDGAYTVTPSNYNQNNMNSDDILPNDPLMVNDDVTAIIAQYNEEAGPLFAQVVGVYGEVIDSREVQAAWATQLIYDYIYDETGESYVTLQNAGGLRDTAPYDKQATDAVTLGYLFTMMPFDNEIVLMDLSGDQLLTILNNTPDGDEFISAAVIIGATQDGDDWVLFDGEVITDDGIYKVACNDFMYNNGAGAGGDNFAPYLVGENVSFMGVPLRDAVVEVLLERLGDQEIPGGEVELPDDWAIEEVAAAIELGLVPAYLQSNYTQATTRLEFAELAVIVYELIAGEITDYEEGVFSDTDSVFANKAAAIEVVNGFEDGTFGPDMELSREQAATMLARLANAVGSPLPEVEMDFTDSDLVQDYAIIAVGQVQAAEIMRGMGDGTFAPQGTYERQQSIMTILRIFNELFEDVDDEDAEEIDEDLEGEEDLDEDLEEDLEEEDLDEEPDEGTEEEIDEEDDELEPAA